MGVNCVVYEVFGYFVDLTKHPEYQDLHNSESFLKLELDFVIDSMIVSPKFMIIRENDSPCKTIGDKLDFSFDCNIEPSLSGIVKTCRKEDYSSLKGKLEKLLSSVEDDKFGGYIMATYD